MIHTLRAQRLYRPEALRLLARHGAFVQRFRPGTVCGYASACHLLTPYLATTRWGRPRGFRAIFTTAEPMLDFQRQAIQERVIVVLRDRVYALYFRLLAMRKAGLRA
jgi:hypothetical protein